MNEYIVVITDDYGIHTYSVWETTPWPNLVPHTLETAQAQAATWDSHPGITATVYQRVD